MKKHESLEKAPDKPFWQIKKGSDLCRIVQYLLESELASMGSVLTSFLSGMSSWGRLGATTKEQSDDFHATIMEKVLNNAQEP